MSGFPSLNHAKLNHIMFCHCFMKMDDQAVGGCVFIDHVMPVNSVTLCFKEESSPFFTSFNHHESLPLIVHLDDKYQHAYS